MVVLHIQRMRESRRLSLAYRYAMRIHAMEYALMMIIVKQ